MDDAKMPSALLLLAFAFIYQVTFKVEFQAGASGRSFGWVKLNGDSLAVAVASQGWARVKDQGTSSKSSELDELVRPTDRRTGSTSTGRQTDKTRLRQTLRDGTREETTQD